MPELMSLKIYFVSPLFNSTESVFAFENWMKYLSWLVPLDGSGELKGRLGLFFSVAEEDEASGSAVTASGAT